MQTHIRKRIEIVAEATQYHRLTRLLDELDVTGYTVLPIMGGRGESGPWTREGQVSRVGEKILVICITGVERADAVVAAVHGLVSVSTGLVSMSDVEVIRGEKF